jgi:hypothetical protein
MLPAGGASGQTGEEVADNRFEGTEEIKDLSGFQSNTHAACTSASVSEIQLYKMHKHNPFLLSSVTKQVGSSGKTFELYSGGAQSDSRPGH